MKGCKFYLCSALMAIEQWGFFSVPYLLWYGASVYNGHPREPVTPVAVNTCFNDLGRGSDSNTQPSACGTNSQTHCATASATAIRICLYGCNFPKQDYFNENPYDIAGFWMNYVLSLEGIYLKSSLELQVVPSNYTFQSERTDCPVRGNELQSERTSCLIRGNELLIRENGLHNSI